MVCVVWDVDVFRMAWDVDVDRVVWDMDVDKMAISGSKYPQCMIRIFINGEYW